MLGPDSYYTPESLAEKLLSYVQGAPTTAADFCVGDGGLLVAAVNRFPNVSCFGIDISHEVIKGLKKKQPEWTLCECDFKDERAIKRVGFLKRNKMQLITLNPPFTCRGSRVEHVMLDGEEYNVSKALSFVVASLPYLAEDGELYAILPISCVYSEKDSKCWQHLQIYYNAQLLERVDRVYFSGKCSPNIAIVYFGRRPYNKHREALANEEWCSSLKVLDIIRGNLSTCVAKIVEETNEGIRYIHTTNLRKGQLTETKHVMQTEFNCIIGNGVLIPRVCNPNPEKIVVFDGEKSVLSDCVVFLKTRTLKQANDLRIYLLNNWKEFSALYIGTGARYVTVRKLKEVFGL